MAQLEEMGAGQLVVPRAESGGDRWRDPVDAPAGVEDQDQVGGVDDQGTEAGLAAGKLLLNFDPIMDVAFARQAQELLTAANLEVEYHESDAAHHIDPADVPAAVDWLRTTLDLSPGKQA